ncbi:hypothetical protein CO641_01900 [Lysobacteraceae bacterium NML91-0213]|nr:hypothetical protein CO641_01900 [Xanthomonadaceae bacterium NML91-0213]
MSQTVPSLFRSVAAAAVLVAGLLAGPDAVRAQAHGPYVDVSAYISSDEDIDAWYGMTWQLRRDFDDICGDTFCEGEYTNIESLRFQFSVHRVSGRLGMCVWSFAASDEVVDPASGKVVVRPRTWQCRAPIGAGTTLEELLAAVGEQSPLYAPLPGGRSVFEGLVDCL